MKHSKLRLLMRFAIEKRICNRTFIGYNLILVGLIFGIFFCDLIIQKFSPDFFQVKKVFILQQDDLYNYVKLQSSTIAFEIFHDEQEIERILNNGAWVISKMDDYHVMSNQEFSPMLYLQVQQLLLAYEEELLQSKLTPEQYRQGKLPSIVPIFMGEEKESTVNQTWAFLLITSIYFVALSYVGIAASDVVYEKSTRMMELILTSVSSTTHLIAKLLSGWLVLIFQLFLMSFAVFVAGAIRYIYDKGNGFIGVLVHFELLPQLEFNLSDVVTFLASHRFIFIKLIVGLMFMLIGILFIQTILVILSSFIGSIEESGAIQSPFYLLFMGVYYLTIFLNNPTHMNHGIGKSLSMLPFFSMLFMPCRMFYYEVGWSEIGGSLFVACASLIALWFFGAPLYQIGVLDYSSNSIVAKIKSSFLNTFFKKS